MRAPQPKLRMLMIVLWVVALLVLYDVSPLKPWLNLKFLEHQVKSNIDPMELQQWATNLLAYHSSEIPNYNDFHGTNLPSGLKRVIGFSHAVQIFPGWKQLEPNVRVFCGGAKGAPFLVVGSPSLRTPTYSNVMPWKPGIYFVGSGDANLFELLIAAPMQEGQPQ